MTKSRKLFIAAILLAGGYGLAVFLSGVADLAGPSTAADGGLLATFRRLVPSHAPAPGTGNLVPDPGTNVRFTDGALITPRQPFEQPTWLVATPPNKSTETASKTGRLNAAAIPILAHSVSAAPAASGALGTAGLSDQPSARITNVTTTSGSPASKSGSAWDRWPRWKPNAPTAVEGAVAASYATMDPSDPRAAQASFASSDAPGSGLESMNDAAAADESPGERTHVLVDGDSLAKLADRYLDDPELDDEIFRLNRDVLSSPDLLPIGVELRIPDSRMADSQRIAPSAGTSNADRSRAPAGMVPVEWTPQAFSGAPRAQLLRPIPAGQSD